MFSNVFNIKLISASFLGTARYASDDYDLFITNSLLSRYNFPNIAERHFALQLTRMDRVCICILYFTLNIHYHYLIIVGCIKRIDCSSMLRWSLVNK